MVYPEGNVMEEEPQEEPQGEQVNEDLNIAIPTAIRRIVESYCEFYKHNSGRDRVVEQPLVRAQEHKPHESEQTRLNREKLQGMSTQLFSQLNNINHCKAILLSNIREEFTKIAIMKRASLCVQCKMHPYSFIMNRCGHTLCAHCKPAACGESCPVCSCPIEAVLEFKYHGED